MDTGGIANMAGRGDLPSGRVAADSGDHKSRGSGVNTTGFEDSGEKLEVGGGAPHSPTGASEDTGEVGGYEDEDEEGVGDDEDLEDEEGLEPEGDNEQGAMDLSGGPVIIRRIIRRRRRVVLRRMIVPAGSVGLGDIGDQGFIEGGDEGGKWGGFREKPTATVGSSTDYPTPDDSSAFGSNVSMAGSEVGSADTSGFESASTTPMSSTDFGYSGTPEAGSGVNAGVGYTGGFGTPAVSSGLGGYQLDRTETEAGRRMRGDLSFQGGQQAGYGSNTGLGQGMQQPAPGQGMQQTGTTGGVGDGTPSIGGFPLHSIVAATAMQNLIDPVLNVLDNAHAKGTHIIHAEAVIYRVDDLPGSGPIEGRVERITHVDQSNPDAEPMVTASYYTSPAVGNVNTGVGPGTRGVGSVGTAAPV